MKTLNQSLTELYAKRQITLDEALLASSDPEELRSAICNIANNQEGGMKPSQKSQLTQKRGA